jgi:hypothetical protein
MDGAHGDSSAGCRRLCDQQCLDLDAADAFVATAGQFLAVRVVGEPVHRRRSTVTLRRAAVRVG